MCRLTSVPPNSGNTTQATLSVLSASVRPRISPEGFKQIRSARLSSLLFLCKKAMSYHTQEYTSPAKTLPKHKRTLVYVYDTLTMWAISGKDSRYPCTARLRGCALSSLQQLAAAFRGKTELHPSALPRLCSVLARNLCT